MATQVRSCSSVQCLNEFPDEFCSWWLLKLQPWRPYRHKKPGSSSSSSDCERSATRVSPAAGQEPAQSVGRDQRGAVWHSCTPARRPRSDSLPKRRHSSRQSSASSSERQGARLVQPAGSSRSRQHSHGGQHKEEGSVQARKAEASECAEGAGAC
jgi:hypothetical protein